MFKLKRFIGSFFTTGSKGLPHGAHGRHHDEHGRDHGVRLDRNICLDGEKLDSNFHPGSHGDRLDRNLHGDKVDGGNDDSHKDDGIDIDHLGEWLLDGHGHTSPSKKVVAKKSSYNV